jgi:hypothetical protein
MTASQMHPFLFPCHTPGRPTAYPGAMNDPKANSTDARRFRASVRKLLIAMDRAITAAKELERARNSLIKPKAGRRMVNREVR